MLTPTERERIHEEEQLRLELRRDLLLSSPEQSRWLYYLNSPFALWLLSTVVVSLFGFLWNAVSEERTRADRERAQIAALQVQDSEFLARLMPFLIDQRPLARLRTTRVIRTRYPDEKNTPPMVSTLISELNNDAARELQRGSSLTTGAPLPINRLPAEAAELIAANASFVDRAARSQTLAVLPADSPPPPPVVQPPPPPPPVVQPPLSPPPLIVRPPPPPPMVVRPPVVVKPPIPRPPAPPSPPLPPPIVAPPPPPSVVLPPPVAPPPPMVLKPTPPSSPPAAQASIVYRVYIQIFDEHQRARAEGLRRALQALGYVAPGIERVADARSPDLTQVRFFQEDDAGIAGRIAELVRESATQQQTVPRRKIGLDAPSGLIEVWFGRDDP